MKLWAVEATLSPVPCKDWSVLRRMTDVVPGTLLIEDPAMPVLIFPVEAETSQSAAVFIEGVASIAGLTILSGVTAQMEAEEKASKSRVWLPVSRPAGSIPPTAPRTGSCKARSTVATALLIDAVSSEDSLRAS